MFASGLGSTQSLDPTFSAATGCYLRARNIEEHQTVSGFLTSSHAAVQHYRSDTWQQLHLIVVSILSVRWLNVTAWARCERESHKEPARARWCSKRVSRSWRTRSQRVAKRVYTALVLTGARIRTDLHVVLTHE